MYSLTIRRLIFIISILIQSLILASSGLLSVGSITIVILLLLKERGLFKGLAYAMGYLVSYSLIGVTVVLLNIGPSNDKPSKIIMIFSISFGFLLIYISIKNYRKKIEENDGNQGKMTRIIKDITPLKAFVLGSLVTVINFKNLGLFLSALSIVIISDLRLNEKLFISLLVALIFCVSVFIPIAVYLLFPNRRVVILNSIKSYLEKNKRTISIWVPMIFGLIFIVKGVILI